MKRETSGLNVDAGLRTAAVMAGPEIAVITRQLQAPGRNLLKVLLIRIELLPIFCDHRRQVIQKRISWIFDRLAHHPIAWFVMHGRTVGKMGRHLYRRAMKAR
jgi:hypothetical protein